MTRYLDWRFGLGMALALGCTFCNARPVYAQQLPPRVIVPLMNNGSLGVYANPKAQILSQLNQPVLSFIAAAPQDVRLMQAGVPISVDRLIVALQPGTQITVSVPAGQVRVNGPAPAIAQYILSGWGANRGYNVPMTSAYQGGYNPYMAYHQANYNPFTNYNGFFPYQTYNAYNQQYAQLYAAYSMASAYNFQQSTQMNPSFGSFSNTSLNNTLGSSSTPSASTEGNPFAAFDSSKKSEENKEEKK